MPEKKEEILAVCRQVFGGARGLPWWFRALGRLVVIITSLFLGIKVSLPVGLDLREKGVFVCLGPETSALGPRVVTIAS